MPLNPEGASARAAFAGRRRCSASVAGLAGTSREPWDILYQVAANPTGTVVFERGERAGMALVERNGKAVLDEAASSLYVSTSGYNEVSAVRFFDDGTPVYIASAQDGHYFVAGVKAVKIAADNVHHLDSFRVEGNSAKVVATRGEEYLG